MTIGFIIFSRILSNRVPTLAENLMTEELRGFVRGKFVWTTSLL